jgi:hypothetical protein
MTYASAAWAVPIVRIPHLALPRFRWPRLSPRARALLMMSILISPAFLADTIGYGVQRLFLTADQIAAKQVPDATMLKQAQIFRVACADTDMPAMERARWSYFATQHGWPRYPEAGASCFKPDRALFGIIGLKMFSVACPTMVVSVADRRQWAAFAANHGWTDYPQAGEGCVDP